ncbi:hypothetical protein ACLFMI_20330 [Pseudonocardia nantongensis]|uniref:hypothetical protein n=1 Tax=Pseudonocardia nantongensis TaxID=1181885 RepID=UPI00397D84E2
MDLRRVTGYIALALLAGYWLWVLSRSAPELRKGARNRGVRGQVLLVKTAALALTALFVGTVHFWASAWWQVVVAVPVTLVAAVALRRVYRRLVAPPRHRVALAQRVRRTGHFQVIPTPDPPAPHRHAATGDGGIPGTVPFVVPGAFVKPDSLVEPEPDAVAGTGGPARLDGDRNEGGDADPGGDPAADPAGGPIVGSGEDRAGNGDRPDTPTT